MKNNLLIRNIFLLLLVAFPVTVWAHSGVSEKVYVASYGTDTGECASALQPCKTISYALRFAGKHGKVLVASGNYEITNTDELFQMVTGLVEIRGGFETIADDADNRQKPTRLIGVPPQYRKQLEDKGFQVIADLKGIEGAAAFQADKYFQMYDQLKAGLVAQPCSQGSAAGLPCDSVDLLAHVPLEDISSNPGQTADIWGFVDLNTLREYAIVGYDKGTAVIDITDSHAPREVGFIPGQTTVWRDMKAYQFYDTNTGRWNAFAYVTADGASDGLFVIDLRELPQRISKINFASDIISAHNVYLSNSDYTTGLPLTGHSPTLVIAGANVGAGRFRSYTLADPTRPVFVSGATNPDYVHDVSSLLINDERMNTQCAVTGSPCTVLLDFNEDTLDIWDTTNDAAPQRLSSTPYSNSRYTHSGWWSEDGQYAFLQDELDELRAGLATTLRVFSLADLRNPTLVGGWTGPTRAIDHNGFVRGNRYYMSNYSRGLAVLDISNPTSPISAGFLDTYPFSDATSFVGAWGTYPFFSNGVIAISDIDTGLYLARDQTLAVSQGSLQFSAPFFAANEGQNASLTVQRTGGTTGTVSVSWTSVAASADPADYSDSSGRLLWGDGDSSDRTISIPINGDASIEGIERVIVRLVDPKGGATLAGNTSTTLFISDPDSSSIVSFWQEIITVREQGFGRAYAVVEREGSASGAVSVDYSLSSFTADVDVDYSGPVRGTLSWADGDARPKNLEFIIIDDGITELSEYFELTLDSAQGATIGSTPRFTVNIPGSDANSAPVANAGANQSAVEMTRVTLNGNASADPDGDTLTYSWTQQTGPTVTISDASTVSPTFMAPAISNSTTLQFQLQVTDTSGLTSQDVTVVTVTAMSAATSSGGGGAIGLSELLALLLLYRVARPNRKDAA